LKKEKPLNLAASVHQKLLNLAHSRKEDFQQVLIRYALERFLYRLSKHSSGRKFIVKGAFLFEIWGRHAYRQTRDVDFLGFGDPSPERLRDIFSSICRQPVRPDGMNFDSKTVRAEEIREDNVYGGIRIRLTGYLGSAQVRLQFDAGFGDEVIPAPEEKTFPSLLPFPAPHLKVYSRESVVAEKFQAIVTLGMMNSRMKDYYDLFQLSQFYNFSGKTLVRAISATFKNRSTMLPHEPPLGLSNDFSEDLPKQRMWDAFLNRIGQPDPYLKLSKVVDTLHDFLMPPASAAANKKTFNCIWQHGGPWKKR
jgi:predicted nucleotidyltransferase component of viral defense system